MKRFPDWLVYLLVLFALWIGFGGDEPERDDLPPPAEMPADSGAPLPAPSLFDEETLAEADEVQPGSTGTAFAIGPGVWLTARHVVRGCPLVGLTDNPGRLRVRADVVHMAKLADVAVLRTDGGPEPLSLDLNEGDLPVGATGFHIGYPQGRPGEVVSRLIGRERLLTEGAWRGRENTLAWVETGRSAGLKAGCRAGRCSTKQVPFWG
jgi:serine protease Do